MARPCSSLVEMSDGARAAAENWHAMTVAEAQALLGADRSQGLSRSEAASRYARTGPNTLVRRRGKPAWQAFLDQFKSLLIVVLGFAALMALAIGDVKDAVVILVVVLINATLGFRQEHRAETAVAALKRMLASSARVRRQGAVEQIDVTEVVPGDIVLVEGGDRIPADGLVVESHAVEVDESALTGESHAVEKCAGVVLPADTPLAERSNFAFMNTSVTRGRMELLATATGMTTEMGRLASMLETAKPAPTPLQTELDVLGKRLALIALSVVSLTLFIDVARGQPFLKEVMDSIALAVAAIPEGLPAVVTVTLALGMQRMAKNRAIVRKLAAVETLGSTTVICSDKTGTLTMNQMTARRLWFRGEHFSVSGEGYSGQGEISKPDGGTADLSRLTRAALLCNEARIEGGTLIGDPTEGALLGLAHKSGLDTPAARQRHPRLDELPFDSVSKLMATFHRDEDSLLVLVKGAPDVLLARSSALLGPAGVEPLDSSGRQRVGEELDAMTSRAMRVLAVAERRLDPDALDGRKPSLDLIQELTLLGLVGIVDPPRPEARAAVELCRRAGIQVKMVTGDQKGTAEAIAREIGIEGKAVSGTELEALSDEELRDVAQSASVFARVSPEHKLRIVEALRATGHVVAMTGDGVNDAPALKTADIGVAMGLTGTEVSKEAAAMVLADDDFATIVRAVEEGRTIYENIVKFVRFQLSTNIGAVLTVTGASLFGLPSPFTAIQLLWINIIMDGPPAMTLGLDPPRPGIMNVPPRRPDDTILPWRRFGQLLLYGTAMATGTLVVFWHGLVTQGERYGLTLAFTTFVFFQVFNVHNARSEGRSALSRATLENRHLWLSLFGVVLLQVLIVALPPARSLFDTEGLAARDWILAIAVGSTILWFEELRKWMGASRQRPLAAAARTPAGRTW